MPRCGVSPWHRSTAQGSTHRAGGAARLRLDVDPEVSHHVGELGGRRARATEHLAPTESERSSTVSGCVEIALEIGVTSSGRVVEQPTVQLDEQRSVVRVAIDQTLGSECWPLPIGPREPMRSLDASEEAVFEHRARAGSDVAEDCVEPAPATHSLAARQRLEQPGRRRTSTLDPSGQDRDGVEIGAGRGGGIEDGLLHPHPRRARVPQHSLGQVAIVMDHDAGRWLQTAAASVDGDVDRLARVGRERPIDGAKRGLTPQCCGPARQYGYPGPFCPGQGTGVGDVHAAMHLDPRPPAQQPADLVRLQAGSKSLSARDHAVLSIEDDPDVGRHAGIVGPAEPSEQAGDAGLWRTARSGALSARTVLCRAAVSARGTAARHRPAQHPGFRPARPATADRPCSRRAGPWSACRR